jgi:hypothetical protein
MLNVGCRSITLIRIVTVKTALMATLIGSAVGVSLGAAKPATAEDEKGYACDGNTGCITGKYARCQVFCEGDRCYCNVFAE